MASNRQNPDIDNKPDDERNMFEKLGSGDLRSLDMGDAANATSTAAGFMGPIAGKFLPGVDGIQAIASGVEGGVSAGKESRKISRRFGNPRMLARHSSAFRKKFAQLDDRWKDNMGESIAAAGGGIAAGAALGSLIGMPIPFIGVPIGFLAGSIAGGFIGAKIYRDACVKQSQDPITINEQICKMRDAGENVPAELVFTALAADISGKEGKRADKMLKKLTGTKFFTEALSDEKNVPKLSAMMNDSKLGTVIRAKTKMPLDPNNPLKSVAEQYAELINSGQMDPRNLLIPGGGMLGAGVPTTQMANAMPEVPITPGMERAMSRSV